MKPGPSPRDTLFLDSEDAKLFGRRVAAWCVLHRVQVRDLAAELQVSRWQLARYMSGERRIRVDTVLEICKLTGMKATGDSVSLKHVGTWHQKHPA